MDGQGMSLFLLLLLLLLLFLQLLLQLLFLLLLFSPRLTILEKCKERRTVNKCFSSSVLS